MEMEAEIEIEVEEDKRLVVQEADKDEYFGGNALEVSIIMTQEIFKLKTNMFCFFKRQ